MRTPDRRPPSPIASHASQPEAEGGFAAFGERDADVFAIPEAGDAGDELAVPEEQQPKRPPSMPLWRRAGATAHNLPALPPTELLLSSHDEIAHPEPEPEAEPQVDLTPTLTVFEKANLSSVPDLVKLAQAFHVDSKEIERDSVLELIHKVLEAADESEPLKLCQALSMMGDLEADLGRDDDAESRYGRALEVGWSRVENEFLTDLLMSYSGMLSRIEKTKQARTYASFARVIKVRAEFDRDPNGKLIASVKEHQIDPAAFQSSAVGGFDKFVAN